MSIATDAKVRGLEKVVAELGDRAIENDKRISALEDIVRHLAGKAVKENRQRQRQPEAEEV